MKCKELINKLIALNEPELEVAISPDNEQYMQGSFTVTKRKAYIEYEGSEINAIWVERDIEFGEVDKEIDVIGIVFE